jgi:hypothetical protein
MGAKSMLFITWLGGLKIVSCLLANEKLQAGVELD